MTECDIHEFNADDNDRNSKRVKLEADSDNAMFKSPRATSVQEGSLEYRPYKLKYEISAHDKGISAVKYSPDGSRIASSSADSSIKIWHSDTGKIEQTLYGHTKGLSDVSWSSTGQWLTSASDDCTIRIWNASNGRSIRVLKGHTNFVLCAEFNRAGNLVASGSFDESIKIWDVRAGACLKTLPAHSDPISSVKFNVDGTMLVSCSHDGLIRIWDTASGQCLKTLVDQDSPPVSFASFSPNGRLLLTCTLDSTIRLWNFVSSIPMKTYKGHVNTKYILNAEMCNAEVIVGGEDGKVTIWDTQTKQIRQVIEASQDVTLSISRHVSADGSRSLAVAGLDKAIRVYQDEL